jgi:addiction module RelE/StbE family toxin
VEVTFSPAAITDIAYIRSYIGRFNPIAARHMADRLIAAALSLADFPERGRPIRGNRRELLVIPPYVIRYRVVNQTVQIIRVWHGAQLPDP